MIAGSFVLYQIEHLIPFREIFFQTTKTHLFVVNVDIETISVYQVGFLLLTPVAGHVPEMNITMKTDQRERLSSLHYNSVTWAENNR